MAAMAAVDRRRATSVDRGLAGHSLARVVSRHSFGYTYYQFRFLGVPALEAESLNKVWCAMTSEPSRSHATDATAAQAGIDLQH